MELARVAVVTGTDLREMTHDSLSALGGMDSIVGAGESVFIKPNMVTLPWANETPIFTNGECTKPDIVIAVVEACLAVGAREVVVGDGSQLPTMDWELAVTLDGSTNLVRELERLDAKYPGTTRVASLEVDSPEWEALPSSTYLGEIIVSSLASRADRVITLPVAKTHCWAQLSLSAKNFLGVTPQEGYAHWSPPGYWDRAQAFDHTSPKAIASIYLDIVDALQPDLALIDFSYGIEGDGPNIRQGGRTVDMRNRLGSWLLLASTDIMAADATAARIMSHEVDNIAHLRLGYEMGLGEIHADQIDLLGSKLEELQVPWLPARLRPRAFLGP